MREAIPMHIEAMRESGEPLPAPDAERLVETITV
jgi:predicted RNase H-like HicB family nuclease